MGPPTGILLVDDEPRNLDALEVILGGPSYRLIRATSGDEALGLLLKNDVAVIVLDIQMPEISGFELAKLIQGSKRFRRIPILFLTAHLMDDRDVIAGYGAGGVDYLTKPLNPDILRQKVGVFADLFRKTRALAELNETLEQRVTERTADLERSEAALRAAGRQKDEFLATLAHELRNPLAPLRMGLDLLRRDGGGSNARTLSIMGRQLDHMVRLVDDLLDVARISTGKLGLKKEHTNLGGCIQTALEACRPFLEQRAQVVDTAIDASLYGFADPTRLTQIVSNLLHNASKFTPQGGKVEVTLALEAGRALIRVKDEGVGIAAEQLPRVFEMFTRIAGSKIPAQSGLGIGLALSKKLALLHDGELMAASDGIGKGSVFTLALAATREEASVEPPSPVPAALPVHDLGIQVLIIEDNEDSADVLALWLRSRGYSPSVASTGAAGLALFQEIQPRVVLCDIGLPEMSGIEVCRRIRELPLDYRPVMVALTGWGMKDDRDKTRSAGFDHHLVKPVAAELLAQILGGLSLATA
jgi:signal transduction histidine kinase